MNRKLKNNSGTKLLKSFYGGFRRWRDKRVFNKSHAGVDWIPFVEIPSDLQSQSQYGQDAYLIQLLPDGQTYVEIGANHPVRLNNTLLLEQSGWTGISIDPIRKYSSEWKKHRKNIFANKAIGMSAARRPFTEFSGSVIWADMMSGFSEYVRAKDLKRFDNVEYEVEVDSLGSILDSYEMSSVDLVLIDVEGAEMEILQGIDFDVLRPACLLIENAHPYGGNENIRKLLFDKGYRLHARLGCCDDVYLLSLL